MDKISVIIPVYNVEKYFRKCLDSVINQTYKNLEIIVVDDESPDNCGKIADEYASLESRIKVIHKKNGGVSSARNVALDIATGDYIAFLDSDDIADVREYERLYEILKKFDADAAFCELTRYYDGEETQKEEYEIKDEKISVDEALKLILTNNNIGNYINIKLFKKELFDGIRFPEGKCYEDAATLYKVIGRAKSVAYTNEKLYYYLIGREGAITSSFSEKKLKDSLEAYFGQYQYIAANYPSVKKYAGMVFVKMYTSACEKMRLNNFREMYDSEFLLEKYKYFKKAVSEAPLEILRDNLESYRYVSMSVLNIDREAYWKFFDDFYKLK